MKWVDLVIIVANEKIDGLIRNNEFKLHDGQLPKTLKPCEFSDNQMLHAQTISHHTLDILTIILLKGEKRFSG